MPPAQVPPEVRDPRRTGPKPPFREAPQAPPGSSAEMRRKPDYGEQSYVGHGRLTGRRAIITGGDSGIGRAVALAFAREGADVLISYLSEHEDAAETVRLVRGAGRRGIAVPGTIEDPHHCEEIAARAAEELGGIDILVNNAAMQAVHESIEEILPEEWDRTLRVNIHAMFYLTRVALPRMPPGSAIINTTSVNAFQPQPRLLAYASTKGAIVTFTRALSGLALRQGVRVNAVAPGPVWTPLIPSTMPREYVRKFGEQNPMGRPAQPAELAPTYVFLASEESRFITGSILDLTGGEMVP
jgi:NAD(P)-dependent dehydrogenase (short-subunit alcohol dehydrogenase family)